MNGGKTITRGDLERRWGRRTEKELSLEEWTKKYYGDYQILDLPVPVLAESPAEIVPTLQPVVIPLRMSEARESTTKRPTPSGVAERPANDGHSRGGQKLFDRKGYQRGYMKEWRLRKKLAAEKDAMKG